MYCLQLRWHYRPGIGHTSWELWRPSIIFILVILVDLVNSFFSWQTDSRLTATEFTHDLSVNPAYRTQFDWNDQVFLYEVNFPSTVNVWFYEYQTTFALIGWYQRLVELNSLVWVRNDLRNELLIHSVLNGFVYNEVNYFMNAPNKMSVPFRIHDIHVNSCIVNIKSGTTIIHIVL